eukprot:TRINITY_DN11684_c0_g1_i7.p1 TRINITY_DN11684_c0_g1~~TRINITY_DN11684_c0_g1_i7.p1  ORF type:complete len:911 (+),score=157.12 TRINITY_DN11684_c0_g1_i7:51-2783(+)
MLKKKQKSTHPPSDEPKSTGFRPPRAFSPPTKSTSNDDLPAEMRKIEEKQVELMSLEYIQSVPEGDPLREMFLSLNPRQRQSVMADGCTLVLAGPGSGKTRVIVTKIIRLLSLPKLPPSYICAVTFTNKAAAEMRHRIMQTYGDRGRGVFLGTFHQLCARILRTRGSYVGVKPNFFICDADDSQSLVKRITKELSLSSAHESAYSIINAAKGLRLSPMEYIKQSGRGVSADIQKHIVTIYNQYQQTLQVMGGLDFNDLLLKVVELFEMYPEVKTQFANACHHLLIDEFQDTNMLQFEICKHLSSVHQTMTAVGDPYQCIYSWRGADFTNINKLTVQFPNCRSIFLDQNYRSTNTLLKCTNSIMNSAADSLRGNMWTQNTRGLPVYLLGSQDPEAEARLIARELNQLQAAKAIDWKDVAVLCRNHYMTRAVEEEFVRKSIPYFLIGGVAFYDREEIKDVLSYLRLAMNPKDDFSFQRVVNTPTRGIGQKTIDTIREIAAKNSTSMFDIAGRIALGDTSDGIPTTRRKAIVLFVNIIDRLVNMATRGLSPKDIVAFVLKEISFEDHLRKDADTFQQRWENVHELLHVASQDVNFAPSDDEPELTTPLARFMHYVSLLTGHDDGSGKKGVVISTLHSAKGLEWPVVFITGVETGIIPSYRSLDSIKSLDEERRLFYVGSTRAKALLYWTHCLHRRIAGEMQSSTVSMFIRSVTDEVVETSAPKKTKAFLEDLCKFTGKTPIDPALLSPQSSQEGNPSPKPATTRPTSASATASTTQLSTSSAGKYSGTTTPRKGTTYHPPQPRMASTTSPSTKSLSSAGNQFTSKPPTLPTPSGNPHTRTQQPPDQQVGAFMTFKLSPPKAGPSGFVSAKTVLQTSTGEKTTRSSSQLPIRPQAPHPGQPRIIQVLDDSDDEE